MADKTVRIVIAGSPEGAIRAFKEVAAAADLTAHSVGTKIDAASTKAGSAFSRLGQAMGNFGLPFAGAAQRVGSRIEALDSKGKRLGATMASVGGVAMGALALGLAGAAYESVKLATSFQSDMELLATQAGVPQAEIKHLSDGVLSLAGSVGFSPDSLSAALFHIESTLPQNISSTDRYTRSMNELRIAAEGAKVGHSDLTDVTNALNATIVSGIPGAQNLNVAMGALNATVGAGDMHMQDLAEAMGSGMVAVVKGFGLSLTDVGAALAVFGDNNIRGADAATMLRMGVMSMAKPVATGKKALQELGLTATQLAVDMQTGGLNKAVKDLHDHLVATGNAGVKSGELLTQAFGKKAGPGIAVLTSQFARFETKEREVAAGGNTFGKAYAATTKTLAFQMDQLRATVEALGTKFGLWLIPKLLQTARVVASVVTWFQKHKAVAEALGAAIGGLLVTAVGAFILSLFAADGAIGGLVISLVGATAPLGALTVALFGADAAMGPMLLTFGLVVLAVAAVGAAAYELATHWQTVWKDIKSVAETAWKTTLEPVFNALKAGAEKVWDVMQTAWHGIDDVIHFVTDHIVQIIKVLLIVGLGPIGVAIDLLWTHWKAVWGVIQDATKAVWDFLRPIFDAIVHLGLDVVRTGVVALGTAWGLAWTVIHAAVATAWRLIAPVLVAVVGTGTDAIKTAVHDLQTVWDAVWGTLHSAVEAMWAVVRPIFEEITHVVGDVANAVSKVTGALGAVGGGLGGALGKVGHFLGFAEGGLVTHPTLALVGESGPEVILPLTRPRRMAEIIGQAGIAGFASASPIGGSLPQTGTGTQSITYAPTVNITGLPQQIAGLVQAMLDSHSDALARHLAGAA